MTTHNGKPIFQRGGAGAGRGDDAHGITAGAAKQSRDAFLATEPEPYLAENYEKAPLSDNPFREDRIS